MAVRLTHKRIDIMRSALCQMESNYEGEEVPPPDFSTWQEYEKEIEACHEWLRQAERKRNTQAIKQGD